MVKPGLDVREVPSYELERLAGASNLNVAGWIVGPFTINERYWGAHLAASGLTRWRSA